MKRLLACISMSVLFGMGSLIANAQTPETLVAKLYTDWDGNTQHKIIDDRPEMSGDMTRLQKYFSPTIAKKLYKNAHSEDDNIDVDILYDAQDMEIKNFNVGKFQSKDDNTGFLNVTFLNFNEKRSIKFFLEKLNTGWRVYDIEYHNEGQTYTLKSMLDGPAK